MYFCRSDTLPLPARSGLADCSFSSHAFIAWLALSQKFRFFGLNIRSADFMIWAPPAMRRFPPFRQGNKRHIFTPTARARKPGSSRNEHPPRP
jgi:hypothetical protein